MKNDNNIKRFRVRSSIRVLVCILLVYVGVGTRSQPVTVDILKTSSLPSAYAFPLIKNGAVPSIIIDLNDAKVVHIIAHAVAGDLELVGGHKPEVLSRPQGTNEFVIIAGTLGRSLLIDRLVKDNKLSVANIAGKWESFAMATVQSPITGVKQALVITGSDARGTAYGLFELSKMSGVSPWVWWADVLPEKRNDLFVLPGSLSSKEPSVKYRGIFLNDEDWGLQPWAAKTLEPETGDIGPKTYEKIFELLLRLKANLIWPAMHDCTKAFFKIDGNQQVAEDYGIVVGTSHAEPMLRNNVGEWDAKTMGPFNYITNKEKVLSYWEERVKQSKGMDAIYTMGMRGVHDSKMEGVKDEKEAVTFIEKIMADQRGLLGKYIRSNVTTVPQAFTAYKEVLDIYDAGLKLPDDITLVWPDDNYGYIQRLNDEVESKRPGGSGVYYHASYWGRPHDYLWLPSLHPALMNEEMLKAYQTGAKKLWVLNVGDIKSIEYNMQHFLDMAYDISSFQDSRYLQKHLENWAALNISRPQAHKVASVLWQYYQLAFERKPEFMGWSQTEPTTPTRRTQYNHFYFGDEAQRRIDKYQALEDEVRLLRNNIDQGRDDAFYQLAYYPVVNASNINKKFLYQDKAVYYAAQNRWSASEFAKKAKAAYDGIIAETDYFNSIMSQGKWKHMMSMRPRNLPVFHEPLPLDLTMDANDAWNVAPEGFVRNDSSLLTNVPPLSLPEFDDIYDQPYFIDIYLSSDEFVTWKAEPSQNWIRLSHTSGVLRPLDANSEKRILVSVDRNKLSGREDTLGTILFKAGGKQIVVHVKARRLKSTQLASYKGYIANNDYVGMHAANGILKKGTLPSAWKSIEGLGYTGKALQYVHLSGFADSVSTDPSFIKANHASVEYPFFTFCDAIPIIHVFTLPTHPLNSSFSMRYAVSVDDGPLQIVDFKTFGRSEEWKQNVLSNRAGRIIEFPFLTKGGHTLKIYAMDPGVIFDEIRIDLGGLKHAYGILPETLPKH